MIEMALQEPASVQMEAARGPSDHSRRNKLNSGNSTEQALKCPRCDSLNTKFCYYNNYSLTQPRHFCKNCRRYWTQGGSLRNVPIGGGCRKNKRVKQRTVDPHLFGGQLDDHSSFLQHAAAGGALPGNFLPSSSCFNMVGPGYVDMVSPTSEDNHLLSMAFSRIQESLRLGTGDHPQQSAGANIGSGSRSQLSFMQQHPEATALYEDVGLGVGNGYMGKLRPEHHHLQQQIFNESDQLGLHQENPVSYVATLGNAAGSLASSDHGQLFNAAGHLADAQLRLAQQQQRHALSLHLGGASEHDHEMHMTIPTSCSGSVAATDECTGIGSAHQINNYSHQPADHRYINNMVAFHHRHQLALPDFEEQESPESMSSLMGAFRRSGFKFDKSAMGKGSVTNNNMIAGSTSSCSTAAAHEERQQLESWQQQVGIGHTVDQQQLPQLATNGAGARFKGDAGSASHVHHESVSCTTPSSAGTDHQQHQMNMAFWSPSSANWATNIQDVHMSSGALL
ncbi:hypothetical protein L7F22_035747 [Adiantum nelumboides]|nr:hypothetical protein [Adiantum nelumboides]